MSGYQRLQEEHELLPNEQWQWEQQQKEIKEAAEEKSEEQKKVAGSETRTTHSSSPAQK